MERLNGARLLVRNLEAQGVKHVFGIPGNKVAPVFDALADSSIQTIVCRHEQNATFAAGAMGRLTGKAGVVLVTSGPGCSNLATGLATANTEGDPVVAFGGAVPVASRLKQTHQSMDTVAMLRPVTKFSAEMDSADSISEVAASAFRAAESGRPGAAFVSLPQDIMAGDSSAAVLAPWTPAKLGPADEGSILAAARAIEAAERPVVLLGLQASAPAAAQQMRALLAKRRLAVAGTYQAAGVVPRDRLDCFGGRVGLFHNQIGDLLLDAADLIVTVGYDPVEYDPSLWNRGRSRTMVHVDCEPCAIDRDYRPDIELTGDIAATLQRLTASLAARAELAQSQATLIAEWNRKHQALAVDAAGHRTAPVHPTCLLVELQALLDEDTTICSDIGSFHIWMARHLVSHRPRQLLFSNGQQTLGVGLPWAIGASLVQPGRKVVSVSGDGGFLFSAMELETAVRLKSEFVHMVWIDGSYNMVGIQQEAAFGREAAVRFGPVDLVKYAESMGARGFAIRSPDEVRPVLRKAMETPGPVLVGVAVDYSDNPGLMAALHPDVLN